MNACLDLAKQSATYLSEALPEFFGIAVFDLASDDMPLALQFRAKQNHFAPLRTYIRTILKSAHVVEAGRLTRRGDVLLSDNLYKVSIQLFKDEEGVPGAALVLIQDLQAIMSLQSALASFLELDTTDLEDITPDSFNLDEPVGLDVIDRMVAEFTTDPTRLTPSEKTELMLDLYDTGVFELKGAVSSAADALGMSDQSVYRYLAKIRRARKE